MDPVVLLEIHSGLRWLLIAVTVIALIVTLRSFAAAAVRSTASRCCSSAF